MTESIIIAIIGAIATIIAARIISKKKSQLKLQKKEIKLNLGILQIHYFYTL